MINILNYTAVVVLLAGIAGAAPLAYDDFDYQPDGHLLSNEYIANLTNGSGWAASWEKGSGSQNKARISTTGLSFSNLVVSGGCINKDVVGTGARIGCHRNTTAPALNNSGSRWFSLLICIDGGAALNVANPGTYFGLNSIAGSASNAGSIDGIQLLNWNAANQTVEVAAKSGNNYASSASTTLQVGLTYLVVVEIFDTSPHSEDRVRVYINPVPGNAAPAVPDSEYSGNVSTGSDQAQMVWNVGDEDSQLRIDEFRVGDTFYDVTPTGDDPGGDEPGTPVPTIGSWEAMSPGGGGQIMGVFFDPLVPGKVFEVSDMEGVNLSLDYGNSWTPVGRTMDHGMQFVVVVEPGQTNRVYGGGLTGLNISDDGGRTWQFHDFFSVQAAPFDRGSVGDVAVDPNDTDLIYVGHGWQQKEDILPKQQAGPIQEPDGPRRIAISRDRGVTWETVTYETTDGYKCVYNVKIDPISRRVYLAAEAGVYYSDDLGTNWTRLPDPADTMGISLGCELSPNGETLYATYRVAPDDCRLFAARTSEITVSNAWNDVFYEEQFVDHKDNTYLGNYWQPRIDPRSTDDVHRIMINGLRAPRTGLWEAELIWSGSSVTGNWTQIFWPNWPFDWESGWFDHAMMAQVKMYTPTNWPERVIWAADGEGLFTLPEAGNYLYDWDPRHCERVADLAGEAMYRTRGFDSTYVYTVSAMSNYIIQGQADNGCVQSWDGGQSWTRDNPHQYNAMSNVDDLIITPTDPPSVVMAGMVHKYGGGSSKDPCSLYGRRLVSWSPADGWIRFAGSETRSDDGLNGLDGMSDGNKTNYGPRVYTLDYDRAKPERIYCGSARGIYRTEDVTDLISGETNALFHYLDVNGDHALVRRLVCDPVQEGTLYVNAQNGIWRADGTHTASPVWTQIGDHSNEAYWSKSLAAWQTEGTVNLLKTDGSDLYLSNNRGASWTKTMDWDGVLDLRPVALEPQWDASWGMSFCAVAGFENQLFAAIETDNKHGYAILRGIVTPGTTHVEWVDWTHDGERDFYYPRCDRIAVCETGGTNYLYLATKGNGTWWRSIETASGATYYEEWLGLWPGISDGSEEADPDGDGLNNLDEYALSGNPTNAGDTGIPVSVQTLEEGGSNWFEYIHARYNDFEVRELDYHLLFTTNLLSGSWTNAPYEISGTGPINSAFDSVTNRIPTAGNPQRFIKLNIGRDW